MFNLLEKILLGVCGVLLGLVVYLWWQLNTTEADLKTAITDAISEQAQKEIAQANLSECKANIDLQNERIKAVALDGERLKAQLAKAKASANAKFKPLRAAETNTTCESRLNLALQVIKKLGREEQ